MEGFRKFFEKPPKLLYFTDSFDVCPRQVSTFCMDIPRGFAAEDTAEDPAKDFEKDSAKDFAKDSAKDGGTPRKIHTETPLASISHEFRMKFA